MNPGIHILILTTIAVAIFALVMANGWVNQVERRLTSLESKDQAESGETR